MPKIETVGIIGFGVMGAAIGLKAASSGYKVIFKEVNDELLHSMYKRGVIDPLGKKVRKNKITQNEMDYITDRIAGTTQNKDIAKCDLIIEAAVERLDLKQQILSEIDKVCSKKTIIVSNTSTFPIEEVMEKISNPSRTAGLHYFFPATVNRLVEVIRQKETSEETFQSLIEFAENNDKVAIAVKDFPGFAINPIFISSYMVLDSFYDDKCNIATLDEASKLALATKFGIMWVQNGSGLSTCYHAAESMRNYLGDTNIGCPKVPLRLKEYSEKGILWNLEDGKVTSDLKTIGKVKEHLLGSIFAISTHLIEQEVVSKDHLEIGICTALAWPRGPLSMMNDMGMEKATQLVHIAVDNGYFKMPKRFGKGIPKEW